MFLYYFVPEVLMPPKSVERGETKKAGAATFSWQSPPVYDVLVQKRERFLPYSVFWGYKKIPVFLLY